MGLYILNGRIVWYANEGAIRLLIRKEGGGRGRKAEDSGCCAGCVTSQNPFPHCKCCVTVPRLLGLQGKEGEEACSLQPAIRVCGL